MKPRAPPGGGRVKRKPAKKPDVAFTWSDTMIEQSMQDNSDGRYLAKYTSADQVTSDGSARATKKWDSPALAMTRHRADAPPPPRSSRQLRDPLEAKRARDLQSKPLPWAMQHLLAEWAESVDGKRVAAAGPAALPIRCFDDSTICEQVHALFLPADDLRGPAAFTLAASADASAGASLGEWLPCALDADYVLGKETYLCTMLAVDGCVTGNTVPRAACEVVFEWQDRRLASVRLAAALVKRREAEALLRVKHYTECMPRDGKVVKTADAAQWLRILSVALSNPGFSASRDGILQGLADKLGPVKVSPPEAPPPSPNKDEASFEAASVDADEMRRLCEMEASRLQCACALAREAMQESDVAMNRLVLMSDVLNAANFRGFLALGLPAPSAEKGPPDCGVLDHAAYDFAARFESFRSRTFVGEASVVRALVAVLVHAKSMQDLNVLQTVHKRSESPRNFASGQEFAIAAALRLLKEQWVGKTGAAVRHALSSSDRAVYNLDEGTMAAYARMDNKLFALLKRVNYTMARELFLVTARSLGAYAAYVVKACEGTVTVHSPSHVEVQHPNEADRGKAAPIFLMTVCITSEPTLLNSAAIEEQRRKALAWHLDSGGEGECPFPALAPLLGLTFSYETPLEDMETVVISAFRLAIRELRQIPHVQKIILDRLFWPRPEMIPAVTGETVVWGASVRMKDPEEAWVGELEVQMRTAVQRAMEPARVYLECFQQWEAFLNVDVEAYVRGLAHCQLSEEAVLVGEEAESPPVKVDLVLLRGTLRQHRNDVLYIDSLIPSRPLEAGLCLLNAAQLRGVLAAKHDEILGLVLSHHAAHVLQVAHFIETRFSTIEVALKKKPRDIEETRELEQYLADVPGLVQPLQEFIEEMRLYSCVLDDYEFRVDFDHFEKIGRAAYWPCKVQMQSEETQRVLDACRDRYLEDMMSEQDRYAKSLHSLESFSSSLAQYDDLGQVHEAASKAQECMSRIHLAEDKAKVYNSREMLFGRELTDYDHLKKIKKAFEPYYQLWNASSKWLEASEAWHQGNFVQLDAEALESDVMDFATSIQKALKHFEKSGMAPQAGVAAEMKRQIAAFKPCVPVVVALRNRGMRQRHWLEIGEALGVSNLNNDITLAALLEMDPLKHQALILKVSEAAAKEYNIEVELDKMLEDWSTLELHVVPYRDTGTGVLKGVDDITAILDEHVTMTQAMQFSAFKQPFESRIETWNHKLYVISEVLEAWLQVQRNWMYLQPIFESPDINKQLPAEGRKFASVDKTWKQTISSSKQNPLVMDFCDSQRLLERMQEAAILLDQVQKGLSDYLETKRGVFSRFYFLSNDDLLSILSESKDVTRVQPHFKKCFEAIDSVEFREPDLAITKMISPEKEVVQMMVPVDCVGKNVEDWMLQVEEMMRLSIQHVMRLAIEDYPKQKRTVWMQKWPSMCVLNGSQMHWTMETESDFDADGKKAPQQCLARQLQQLDDMIILVRGHLPKAAREQVGALAVIDVHARDVMVKLVENGVESKDDFAWMSQLRYYWVEGDLFAEMVAAKRKYGYEYLGNSFRLVITPLTDKCYLTLMGALQMILGGAPAGPAGTGKTETTKDLAKAVAMQCVVFNCSDGLDYQAMGKFFKGLASCGAWACFDEFNRINIEVLSVIGQQIASIQLAIKGHVDSMLFEGSCIRIKRGFGVFITMNPGYAGRSALPDSLSALFRPVAMMVPDYALIGEIMFFAYGFAAAKELGSKMVTTFKLCSEQCSSQPHYDYGMRAVKTVITAAGNLKQAEPTADEFILLLRALQDVNVPKFLAGDLPLFQGIISDLFPGLSRPELDYGALFAVLKLEMQKANLQPHAWFVSKIIQLYEMIVVRHGLMLVGPTGGGKSANMHILEATLGALCDKGQVGFAYQKVHIFQLNPKSITMGQMYGEFDPNTREWQDGIMSTMYRRAAASTTLDRKWILFDGPVDAIWIENMNTVLDDNKKLCLVSGESVKMSNEMTLLFEVADLNVASPATVSRVGIIYMEPKALGVDPVIVSWMAKLVESPNLIKTDVRARLTCLFDKYMYPALSFVRRYSRELVPSMDNNLCASLLRLLDCDLEPFKAVQGREARPQSECDSLVKTIEARFIFALVWSVGCTGNESDRLRFDAWLRACLAGNESEYAFPKTHTVYDYTFVEQKWAPWMETVDKYVVDTKLSFAELIVPTADSVRSTYLLAKLLEQRSHVLFVGETGTGKTVNISQYLQGASSVQGAHISDSYLPLSLTFSAQSSANMTQDTLDGKLEKRRRGVFGPPAGKAMVVHVDDLNMPKRETYGAQPPIEMLRQWFDQGGWYDRTGDLGFRRIVDLVFVGSMGPPGGGRQEVTPRFIRHFHIIGLAELSDQSKAGIFGSILGPFFEKFAPDISKAAVCMVAATIEFFNAIVSTLLPTPAKSHYTFNLRDLASVFKGVLMGSPHHILDVPAAVRLWVHELSRVFEDRLTCTEDHDWFQRTCKGQVSSHFGLEWHSVVPSLAHRILFCDFLDPDADPRLYVEVTDAGALKTMVDAILSRHNAESKSPMPLVMFGDAIEHVVRIARILRQPQGNALLLGVGGSGRQSMSKLATYVLGYELFQVEISKGYGVAEWRDDIRRCLLKAGVENTPTTFLFSDVQVVTETFLEDLNNILNAGDVANLYGPEEMESIIGACRGECAKKGVQPTKQNIFAQYVLRVRRNLHICLCMSPLGETFRERLRQFPSIVNCSTIDWFTEWPAEALESVGRWALALQNAVENVDAVVSVFKAMHQSVESKSVEFWETLRRRNYVTPTSYLELLSSFSTLLGYKRLEVQTKKDRLQNGLDKLTTTKTLVSSMQKELEQLRPLLISKGAQVDEMMVKMDVDKMAAARDKVEVESVELKADGIATRAKAIADDAQKDLDEALPALHAAVQCLKELKKANIDEVKSLRNPPNGVRLTMEVACLYFEVAPVKKPDPNAPGKKYDDYFEPAQKVLLADANKFLSMLQNFDKDHIPDRIIKRVGPYMTNEDFTPEKIKQASVACTAVCMWAHAMHKYHFVSLGVAPKKAALAEATSELDSATETLTEARARLLLVVEKLEFLEKSLKEAVEEKSALACKEEECKTRLSNADKLIGGLGGEQARWAKTVQDLTAALLNVVGDVLVSAGTVSYLGPFTADFRGQVVDGWHGMLQSVHIPHTHKCDVVLTLAEPVKIRTWQLQGLPGDNLSTQNAIMLDRSRRWALFIDPQSQANRFVRNRGRDRECCRNGFDVISLSEKNFLRTLEQAVRFGKWALLENIGETLEAALEPILLQQKFKSGGQDMIKLGENTIPYHADFKLIMTTKLPNPHYPPEVQVKVSLINFTVTQSGLEEQLLVDTVQLEMPDLAAKKSELVLQQASMNKQLFDIESEILQLLSNSEGNILDDTMLIETLNTAKNTANDVAAKMRDAESTSDEVNASSEEYRPVAKRASLIYFCLADLANVDPMYQYALPWFKSLFAAGVRKAPNAANMATRLENLNDFFTHYVYTNVCRALFEKHKLLFSFLLTAKMLNGEGEMDGNVWRFVISGQSTTPPKSLENPDCEWIEDKVWFDVCNLGGVVCEAGTRVDFGQLPRHFSDNAAKWKRVYDSAEPQSAKLPPPYHQLSGLQHLCVLRCLRRDKLTEGMAGFVAKVMGPRYVEPPPFHLQACFDDSSSVNPLVFVLSTGSDPNKDILDLAHRVGMADRLQSIALGQGQGAIAAKLIEKSTADGSWVLLQNCHLCISWLPALERLCEALEADKVHESFRLWLTSISSAHFPVSILQSAVKMTKEPPRGLRANLRTTFIKMSDEKLNRTNKPEAYRKLLFGLCFFHALIIERKKFGPLGWNVPYDFNETDLDICIAQLELYVDQYDNVPYQVLRQLTSVVNYGGRVTDDKDMRTADIVISDFLTPQILADNYKFSRSGTYSSVASDAHAPLKSYLDYIDSMPSMPDPEVFGMHDNASISCALQEADDLCDVVVSLQPRTGQGGGRSREDVTAEAAAAMESTLPHPFDVEAVYLRYPTTYAECLNTTIVQECARFAQLGRTMVESLRTFQLALKGLVVLSSDLEAMGAAIYDARVPEAWTKCAYPSLKPLPAWYADLVLRLQFVQGWIDGGLPHVLWISAFFFPQGFMTANVQNYARRTGVPVDTVQFGHVLLSETPAELSNAPTDGCYISGLFLEGARWDKKKRQLADPRPKELFAPMPLIHLIPQVDRVAPVKGIYRCPVYKITTRTGTLSTTGHSTNFVFWLEIPSTKPTIFRNSLVSETNAQILLCDQDFWVKAGAACFCALKY
ncbi:dynein heavy chain and region D6 of dynein motor-domain-containing protein [Pelagophyceae sp. CCMP2097]|nr:dynein heavy chain and region D6 of dynein motor-domain-containing protein [Pelagophyceae sp. CCMP2097]